MVQNHQELDFASKKVSEAKRKVEKFLLNNITLYINYN